MEFLNKRYNKAIVSNELSEMHNLSIFFSKMDDMLENTVKRVDKGIEGCSSNIEYMEKYIADIGKQIEQMERDNLLWRVNLLAIGWKIANGFWKVKIIEKF